MENLNVCSKDEFCESANCEDCEGREEKIVLHSFTVNTYQANNYNP